jgi:hypothetical protein
MELLGTGLLGKVKVNVVPLEEKVRVSAWAVKVAASAAAATRA